ncbi:Helix-turn-helix domain-containing protein [Cyclobacterium xiamenense]|uniref:Helix-turn-helix domain-containing protein n=1 Tax=Cyclobacterium xiamenense TaxID=1297121 RepID=A0A1H7AQU3_9BACT|nr:LexA family transcriptional regulator [Cyclobacterium xiamenense]SEJ66247.1 Helix-turn-helix domain-containing protein [Cyclobacterium xiamenense]
MKKSKNFFPGNLKFLRERKGLTQQGLAAELALTRSKLNALESGQTKAPSPEDFLGISSYFGISIDSLIRVDLRTLGELKLRDLEAGNDVYMRGGNLRVLAISVDKGNQENVEYVPIKAKSGYLSGYNDPEFIASLPRFSLPNLPRQGTYRIFPTVGDSMLPIPGGSDIITRYQDDWTALKPDSPCVVILSGQQDFVFKLVTVQAVGQLLLRSLNPIFEPYTVPVGEVAEIWKFHAYTSKEIPEPETDLQQLVRAVREMQLELKGRKG